MLTRRTKLARLTVLHQLTQEFRMSRRLRGSDAPAGGLHVFSNLDLVLNTTATLDSPEECNVYSLREPGRAYDTEKAILLMESSYCLRIITKLEASKPFRGRIVRGSVLARG